MITYFQDVFPGKPLRGFSHLLVLLYFRRAGADGFVVVDLLPDEAQDFVDKCRANQLSFIPLVSPTTTDDRMPYVASAADSFIYCVRYVLSITHHFL